MRDQRGREDLSSKVRNARWLPLAGLAVLTVATLGMLAYLAVTGMLGSEWGIYVLDRK